MYLEIEAQQLTEEWYAIVQSVMKDPAASEREKRLASCLKDCGTVLNRLVIALNNATVKEDD